MEAVFLYSAAWERSAMTAPENARREPTDAALVEASRQGDSEAFGQLYVRYARMVHGVILSRTRPAEAEDLVQDVFIRAWPRLHSLRDATRFGGWLATIARHLVIDQHRQTRVENDAEGGNAAEQAPADDTSDTSEAEEILKCIQDLPEAYRETLLLRLVEGMTGPEIAAKTGLSPGSVRVNLHRGMTQLREKLNQRGFSRALRRRV